MYIKKTLLLCLVGAAVLSVCTFIYAKWYHYENSPAKLAATLIANPEYLKECKTINPSRQTVQLDYLGIFPGQSTDEDVLTLLGAPTEQNEYDKLDEWIYTELNVYIEDNIVTSVDVHSNARTMLNLKDLILKYGCPDLIFVVDTSIDYPGGNYNLTKFMYYNTGVQFFFNNFPISLSDIPTSIVFFKPESLESYLERYSYDKFSLENGKPVLWTEAVK